MQQHKHGKPRTKRQLQVGELMKQVLSELFMRGDYYGPRGETFSVTVSEVRVSADLRNATIFVMPLGGKDADSVIDTLNAVAKPLRGELSRRIDLRYMPALIFRRDESFDVASRINELFQRPEVKQDLDREDDGQVPLNE